MRFLALSCLALACAACSAEDKVASGPESPLPPDLGTQTGPELIQTFYVERDLPNVLFHAYRAEQVYVSSSQIKTAARLIDGCDPSASEQGWARCTHTCCAPGSSWRPWTRESLCAMCRSPLVTPIPARRPSMTAVERTSTATQRTS